MCIQGKTPRSVVVVTTATDKMVAMRRSKDGFTPYPVSESVPVFTVTITNYWWLEAVDYIQILYCDETQLLMIQNASVTSRDTVVIVQWGQRSRSPEQSQFDPSTFQGLKASPTWGSKDLDLRPPNYNQFILESEWKFVSSLKIIPRIVAEIQHPQEWLLTDHNASGPGCVWHRTNLSSWKMTSCPQVSCPRSPSSRRAPCPALASPLLVLFFFLPSEQQETKLKEAPYT